MISIRTSPRNSDLYWSQDFGEENLMRDWETDFWRGTFKK